MTYSLFLDDERNPQDVTWALLPDVEWVIVRNFWEFKKAIHNLGVPDYVSFDHDLGDYEQNRNGLECAKELYDHCVFNEIPLPRQYFVHSMNPVGKNNIVGYIESAINFLQKDSK